MTLYLRATVGKLSAAVGVLANCLFLQPYVKLFASKDQFTIVICLGTVVGVRSLNKQEAPV